MNEVQVHPIRRILTEQGINGITIIDDEFDPPKLEDYSEEDIQAFLEEINTSEIKNELKSLGIKVDATGIERENFSNVTLAILWNNKKKLELLKEPCDKHFSFSMKNNSEILRLIEEVNESLGISIHPYGAEPNVDELTLQSDKLFLIDYYLGPHDIPGFDPESGEHPSVKHAKKLVSCHACIVV